MDPSTATATPLAAGHTADPTGLAVVLLVLLVVGYAGSCWIWPYAHCQRCDGEGKFARSDAKVWRLCKRCGGNGRRLRWGRRIYNFAHRRATGTK